MRIKPPTTVDHIKDVLSGAIVIVIGITLLIAACFLLYFTFNTVKSGVIWLSNNWFKFK